MVPTDIYAQTVQAAELWRINALDSFDCILLLPHYDKRLNALLCKSFTARLHGRSYTVIEGRQAAELIALYSLYAFSDKLIIGSFDLPHGRKLRNLLDSGVATEDELINDVILTPMNVTGVGSRLVDQLRLKQDT